MDKFADDSVIGAENSEELEKTLQSLNRNYSPQLNVTLNRGLMADVQIKLADLSDPRQQIAIVELVNAYALEPQGGGERLPDEINARIPQVIRDTAGAFVILAWDESRPVGGAICFRGFSTFKGQPVVNVHDLSVLASHRGRGIGRALLAAVESHARETGCCKVTMEVREANPQAEDLYRKLGYSDPDGFPTRFLDKVLR